MWLMGQMAVPLLSVADMELVADCPCCKLFMLLFGFDTSFGAYTSVVVGGAIVVGGLDAENQTDLPINRLCRCADSPSNIHLSN